MSEKITMQKIADKVGVSKVTVSKVLNGMPGISEETQKKIINMANELGYKKKNRIKTAQAKNLKLFLMISKRYFLEDDKFYTVIVYHLNNIYQKLGAETIFTVVNAQNIEEVAGREYHGSGIFLIGEFDKDFVLKLSEKGLPIVGIDFYMPNIHMDFVMNDNYNAAFYATQFLIDCGHTKIGFSGNIQHSNSITDRYYGDRKALYKNNIKFSKDWIIQENDYDNVYSYDFSLPADMPTAFLCHSDKTGIILKERLATLGYKVPDDVSIISFDNTERSAYPQNNLTAIDIDTKGMAYKAHDLMMNRLAHPSLLPQKYILSSEIVHRASVKRLG